jgi:c-di-GMP-binding flagellar brake protein YcgR
MFERKVMSENKQEPQDSKTKDSNPMLTEWYILKGENKFGPFQYTDVIKMLQEKVVFEFDYAWKMGMAEWTRIAELNEYLPEHIKKLQNGLMPEIKNVFFRRKHPRVPFQSSVVVHDNNQVWKGEAIELSEGGVGLTMENSLVIPGQKLYMHFKPADSMPAFNAICEVVSKKFIDGVKDKNTTICYGVKFINISSETFQHLQMYTKGNLSKASA